MFKFFFKKNFDSNSSFTSSFFLLVNTISSKETRRFPIKQLVHFLRIPIESARKYPFRRNETSLRDLEKGTLFIILLFYHAIYFSCTSVPITLFKLYHIPKTSYILPRSFLLRNPILWENLTKSSIEARNERSLVSDDFIPMEPVILDLYRVEPPSFEPK